MRYFYLFIAFCLSNWAIGQSIKKHVEIGDQYFEEGDYYGASLEYAKAVEIDSIDIHLLFKYAESLRMYNNHTKAAYYYQKIYNKDRGRIYPKGIFWLAKMQKHNQEYRLALKSWRKAASLFKKNKKSYEYLRARHEAFSTSWAMRAIKDTADHITIKNLGEGVNTTNWEFAAEEKHGKFFFSSLRSEKTGPQLQMLDEDYSVKVYEASKAGESWATKEQLPKNVNRPLMHTAAGSFSTDGTYFYFAQSGADFLTHIYVCEYNHGKWSEPTQLKGSINGNDYVSSQPHYFEIKGKSYLLYSSTKPGGQGGYDIWLTELKSPVETGIAKNLGKEINSPADEVTPYFETATNTFYFSSEWHKNLGGFDVFQCKGGRLDSLGKPENMGLPVNTSWNDFYFKINPEGEGYLTSNRLGSYFLKGPTCCNDIWRVTIRNLEEENNEIVIQTLDDLNQYLPVTLYFHNDCPNPRTTDTVTDLNYLTTYKDYIQLTPKYQEEYSKGLAEEKAIEAQLDIEDFFEDYVDKGVKDLALFTDLLLGELEKGANIVLTIKGFASPLAKTDYNVKLTGRRISSLENYLREFGTGMFNDYIDGSAENGGSLSFVRIPFGEYTASSLISDNLNDQKNSVYSRAAALERKIEVQSVTQARRDSLFAEMTCDQELFDLGKLNQGEVKEHVFLIKNTGNIDLEIERVVAKCGCNVVDFPTTKIVPGGQAEIKVTLDTANMLGKQVKSVTVVANSFPRNKRLVLTTEVFKK